MAINEMAANGDGIRLAAIFLHVALGHDVGTAHAPGFADVKLVGPVAVVGKLLLVQAPLRRFRTELFRHRFVRREEMEEAKCVVGVFGHDAVARGVIPIGIIPLRAEIAHGDDGCLLVVDFFFVGASGGVAVEVDDILQLHGLPGGGLFAQPIFQQPIAGAAVVLRRGQGNAPRGIVGKAKPPVVVHRGAIGGAFMKIARPAADTGQQLTGVIDGGGVTCRLVEADTGRFLAKLFARLAAPGVTDTRACHEVAFVTGVDEDLRRDGRSIAEFDSADARALLRDFLDSKVVAHFDLRLRKHVDECLLGDAGLEVIRGFAFP